MLQAQESLLDIRSSTIAAAYSAPLLDIGVAELDFRVVLPQASDLVMRLQWCACGFPSFCFAKVS